MLRITKRISVKFGACSFQNFQFDLFVKQLLLRYYKKDSRSSYKPFVKRQERTQQSGDEFRSETEPLARRQDLMQRNRNGFKIEPEPKTLPTPTPFSFESYKFSDLGLPKAIKHGLGFKRATETQHKVLSEVPTDRNLIIKAKTGTGKTLAYLATALDSLLREYLADPSRAIRTKKLGILVIVPSRELATQIYQVASKLVEPYNLGAILLLGSKQPRTEGKVLQKTRHDVIIGTPGTLLEYTSMNVFLGVSIRTTRVLIIDEADKMLRFDNPYMVSDIIKRCPPDVQTIVTSATINEKTLSGFQGYFIGKDYKMIDCTEKEESLMIDKINQSYVQLSWDMQYPMLYYVIKTRIAQTKVKKNLGTKIIVFLPTVTASEEFSQIFSVLLSSSNNPTNSKLDKQAEPGSINTFLLHGRMSQKDRDMVSSEFRLIDCSENKTSVLFTTDVTARGIDYPGVDLILQVGLPFDHVQYVHRIGRTGRAEASGESIIFLSINEKGIIPILKDVYNSTLTHNTEFGLDLEMSIRRSLKTAEARVFMQQNGSDIKTNDFDFDPSSNSDTNTIIDLSSSSPKARKKFIHQTMIEYFERMELIKQQYSRKKLQPFFFSLLAFYKTIAKTYDIALKRFAEDLTLAIKPLDEAYAKELKEADLLVIQEVVKSAKGKKNRK